jgi:hypothetical protein
VIVIPLAEPARIEAAKWDVDGYGDVHLIEDYAVLWGEEARSAWCWWRTTDERGRQPADPARSAYPQTAPLEAEPTSLAYFASTPRW